MAVRDPTENYGWELPNDQGDVGAWGAMLRVIFGDDEVGVDKVLHDVETAANAAMPKSGGEFTGEVKIETERFRAVDLGSMSGNVNLNLANANVFYGVVTGNVTLLFSNVPADGAVFVTVELTNPGTKVTWPASVKWSGGAPPTFSSTGVDVVTLYTRDGGATWRAALAMKGAD